MQILGKYSKDYEIATRKLVQEREWFAAQLSAIPGVRVVPSQANYVMVEIDSAHPTVELTEKLLVKHDLLVKDLKNKVGGNYLRIAIRNRKDNEALIRALVCELQ